MFIEFADQLEPSGSLSARIQLGVEPTETTPCPFCGREGSAVVGACFRCGARSSSAMVSWRSSTSLWRSTRNSSRRSARSRATIAVH
ncbi:DUF746 domain-containing protein [Burkholderia pseudomallei]|uniref:DUF746 domain-containing protein n=1 Tax=Burkholderia pseudomallei TaxID=28450 RepID=UPI003C7D69F5